MRLENSRTFYRAQFTVLPCTSTSDTQRLVLDVLRNWVLRKERGRSGGRASQLASCLETAGDGGVPAFVAGVRYPGSYDGGSSTHAGSFLRTLSLAGEGTPTSPQYWAMDYDEPDGTYGMRRWHTSVGLTCDDSCRMSVRVTNYLVPGFIGQEPPQPEVTTPTFVRNVIGLTGCQSRFGETVLRYGAVVLSNRDFDEVFLKELLSERRELPLILVLSDHDGKFPVDVDRLARTLVGVANVYAMNCSVWINRQKLREHFGSRKDLWRYRVDAGCVRVFAPRLDPSDQKDYLRHRFFTGPVIEDLGDGFPAVLRGSITRSWLSGSSDVVEVADILAMESGLRTRDLKARFDSLRAQAEANRARETAERAELEREVEDWKSLAESYASEQDELLLRGRQAEDRAEALEQEVDRLQWELSESRATAEGQRSEMRGLERALRGYEGIDHLPTRLSEALELVGRLYADRLVVLPDALSSARRFDGHYELDDEWVILRSIPTTLWQLYFGDGQEADIEDAYKRATGFELALKEGKMTNSGGKYRRVRKRTYEGRSISLKAHVKGKSNKLGEAFRVYYWVDRERRKIVIGHCGDHPLSRASLHV